MLRSGGATPLEWIGDDRWQVDGSTTYPYFDVDYAYPGPSTTGGPGAHTGAYSAGDPDMAILRWTSPFAEVTTVDLAVTFTHENLGGVSDGVAVGVWDSTSGIWLLDQSIDAAPGGYPTSASLNLAGITIAPGGYLRFQVRNGSYNGFANDYVTFAPVITAHAVPEPSSLLFLGLALTGLALRTRRRDA